MTYEDLLSQIVQAIPELQGQLDPPQIVYMQAQGKVYITFNSRVLVNEKEFLELESILRKNLTSHPLALRVRSPGLADAFLADIDSYKQVLVDFLRRNYPSAAPWAGQIGWRNQGSRITLTFPDGFSMNYMAKQNVQGRLVRAILDIFGLECQLELAVDGDQEKRIAALRAQNAETLSRSFSASELSDGSTDQADGAAEKKDKPKTERKKASPGASKKERSPLSPGMTDNAIGKPILGRSIGMSPVSMKTLTAESGVVCVQGDIFKLETKELKGGETLLLTFAVTDYTSSICCKVFMRYRKGSFGRSRDDDRPITEEERKAVQDQIKDLKVGLNVKLRGECMFDNYAHELSITVRDLVPMEKIEREDKAAEKRVELHMHTNMSALDGLTPPAALIERAAAWGHPAVAITDHGVLQAFPDSFHAAKGKIKLIPGCEGYLVDNPVIVRNPTHRPFEDPIVVLDFETTGLNTGTCRAIEIGAVRLVNGRIEDSLSVLINPGCPIPTDVTNVTHITDSMVEDKDDASVVFPQLLDFIGDAPIAAHNAAFDHGVLRAELARLGLSWSGPVLDTLAFARKLYPDMKSHKLGKLCSALGVSLKNAHRAVHDATATAQCLSRMFDVMKEKGLSCLDELDSSLSDWSIGES